MGSKYVVHCKKEEYDIYIGRPGIWGNPFPITPSVPRSLAIEQYKDWFFSNPELVAKAKTELKGKVLGCWCSPQACHGDILAELANNEEAIQETVSQQGNWGRGHDHHVGEGQGN
jgi:hypothetical protein